jgi:hypothetical protein
MRRLRAAFRAGRSFAAAAHAPWHFCGHGIIASWLAEMNEDVRVEGVDLAPGRVALAEVSQERTPRSTACTTAW